MTAPNAPSVQQVFAHELVPEPSDDAALGVRTRYHLARAIGLAPGFGVPDAEPAIRQYADRILLFLAESRVALLHVALEHGLAGDDAARFVGERCHEEVGEWLWQYAEERDVDADRIRRYLLPYELAAEASS